MTGTNQYLHLISQDSLNEEIAQISLKNKVENASVSDLECCKYCNQVWYCKKIFRHNDINGSSNGIKNNENDTECGLGGYNELEEPENPSQAAADSHTHRTVEIESHCHPHRPHGLSYCLPFRGIYRDSDSIS